VTIDKKLCTRGRYDVDHTLYVGAAARIWWSCDALPPSTDGGLRNFFSYTTARCSHPQIKYKPAQNFQPFENFRLWRSRSGHNIMIYIHILYVRLTADCVYLYRYLSPCNLLASTYYYIIMFYRWWINMSRYIRADPFYSKNDIPFAFKHFFLLLKLYDHSPPYINIFIRDIKQVIVFICGWNIL